MCLYCAKGLLDLLKTIEEILWRVAVAVGKRSRLTNRRDRP
jgi:hypothetical protein